MFPVEGNPSAVIAAFRWLAVRGNAPAKTMVDKLADELIDAANARVGGEKNEERAPHGVSDEHSRLSLCRAIF